MSVKRRLPTRKEIGLLRQLNARIGVTRLAQALDIPFYTCRSLLAIDRMTERTLTQVRDRLPKVVGQYLDGPPCSSQEGRSATVGTASASRSRRACPAERSSAVRFDDAALAGSGPQHEDVARGRRRLPASPRVDAAAPA